MDWGMANRLAQLIQSDGHALFLPVDHGYFQGPTRKLEEPGKTIEPLLPYADALFITRGVLRSCVDPGHTRPIILRVSGGTSMVGKDLANEGIITSMEEAIRLNVSAVGISVFIGTDYEKESLLNLSKLVDEGERYGIPVMAVTAVGKELEKRDARYLALSSRIAAELGACVVKTYWCEDFERVAGGCPVPVIMAGGPQVDTEREVFDFVYDGMQKGAIGVNLGRNIWQNDFPVAMIKAIRAIVHDNKTAKEAQEIYGSEKEKEPIPMEMTLKQLYSKCQEQLKALGVVLQPSNEGGFRGYYEGKYVVRLREPGNQYFTINLEKADGTLLGRQRIYDEKAWQSFIGNHLKPRITESTQQI